MSESFFNGHIQLHCGDCLEVLAAMAENSIDSCVTDPPYMLNFMSKAWDRSKEADIDADFAHWFAGFVDGEGCFSVHKKNVNGYKTFDCQFSMTLRDDDLPAVKMIQKNLGGLGTIALRPAPKNLENAKPQVRYCISSQKDCLRLTRDFSCLSITGEEITGFRNLVAGVGCLDKSQNR